MTEDAARRRSLRRSVIRSSASLRRDLPWIGIDDPWAILVAEVMLQQTSTSRAAGPWERFLRAFPSPAACARSPLSEVLRAWSGLGYPRRAKALHDASTMIVREYGGEVPRELSALLELPGVGPYTARAVASFAFAAPVAVLDTNVGRVLSRALACRTLRPREAQELADALLSRSRPAEFNQAMIDLGAQYCRATPRCDECPVRRVCRWRHVGGEDPAPRSAAVSRPQGAFEGSDRQLRGRLLRELADGPRDMSELAVAVSTDVTRLSPLFDDLCREGLTERHGSRLALMGALSR